MNYVGIGLLALGIILGYWQYSRIVGKEISEGRVVELVPHRGSKGGTTYSVVAEFVDTRGAVQTYRSGFSVSSPGYGVGDPIRIYFNRDDPTQCGVLSFGYRFGFAWCLIVLGLALLLTSAGWSFGNAWLNTHFPTTVHSSQGYITPPSQLG